MKEIRIGNFRVGKSHQPFIIAEMSGNHNQSLERALAIVDAAAEAGVQALKLQTYTADIMTLDIEEGEFFIDDPNSLWKGNSLYNLYQQAYTPWEWHEPIFKRCHELGLIALSTPFDETAVDFLESLNVPCYKIASFENTDVQLLKKVASTGKPVIVSTGMAEISELDEAVRTLRSNGCRDIVLLKCTSTYPASPDNCNLFTIPHMKELFQCQIGLSDHTIGNGVAVAAVALGATMIEKHFTLSRDDGGVDSMFSTEPKEMAKLVIESRAAWQALGNVKYGPTTSEVPSLKHRRSLYVTGDIRAGDVFSLNNIKAIRPGLGLPPKYLDIVIGKKAARDIKKGTPLSFDLL